MKFLKSESKSENPKKGKGLKKDQLVILLLFGILLVVIAIPVSPKEDGSSVEGDGSGDGSVVQTEGSAGLSGGTAEETYEQRQERRLE